MCDEASQGIWLLLIKVHRTDDAYFCEGEIDTTGSIIHGSLKYFLHKMAADE